MIFNMFYDFFIIYLLLKYHSSTLSLCFQVSKKPAETDVIGIVKINPILPANALSISTAMVSLLIISTNEIS